METRELSQSERRLTHSIIGAALTVHREFGPGLLESAYEECLAYELGERGLFFERQAERPIVFKGAKLSIAYRPDQLHVGLLLNFNEVVLAKGIKRVVLYAPSFRSNNQEMPLFLVVLRVLRVLRGRFLMGCSMKA